MLSVLTPAFNEEDNLQALYARLVRTMDQVGLPWEWVVVDDHSRDGTFGVISRLSAADARVRGIRLSRNSGSHVAIACALHHVRGDAAVMLAADLQDPPETVSTMVRAWRKGVQVVWAVRRHRPGRFEHASFAAFYYWIMRHVVGMKEMPARGSDCFLIDRAVIEAFRQFRERNVSVLALITWLGFRQEYVEYDKEPRVAGRSGWTFARKVKLVVDSVTGFSNAPIRYCLYTGAGLLMLGIVLGLAGIALLPDLGAGLLIVVAVIVAIGGLNLAALGVIGEYVWRALEDARRRPAYLIEAYAGETVHVPVVPQESLR